MKKENHKQTMICEEQARKAIKQTREQSQGQRVKETRSFPLGRFQTCKTPDKVLELPIPRSQRGH